MATAAIAHMRGVYPAGLSSSEEGAASSAASSSAPLQPPSRLLCLKNLLGPDLITDDAEFKECTDDIRDECARFGTIVSAVFPRRATCRATRRTMSATASSSTSSCRPRCARTASSTAATLTRAR